MKKLILIIIGLPIIVAFLRTVDISAIWEIIRVLFNMVWLIIKTIYYFAKSILELVFLRSPTCQSKHKSVSHITVEHFCFYVICGDEYLFSIHRNTLMII